MIETLRAQGTQKISGQGSGGRSADSLPCAPSYPQRRSCRPSSSAPSRPSPRPSGRRANRATQANRAARSRAPRLKNRNPARRRKEPPSRVANAVRAKPKPVDTWKLEDFVVEPQEGKTRFHDFKLDPRLMHGIHDLGFPYCTPIQAQVLGFTLKGKDAIGRAQTVPARPPPS